MIKINTANAGCLIKLGDKVVTIGHRRSGRLDIPGGTANSGEASQCTAHRETWEETGFNVEVGALLGVSDNGYHVYACKLDAGFDGVLTRFPVPGWAKMEVTSIQLTDLFESEPAQWRFPEGLVKLREYYTQLD